MIGERNQPEALASGPGGRVQPCRSEDGKFRFSERVRDRLIHLAIPGVRAGVRFWPGVRVRRFLWDHVARPRFAGHTHRFTVRTEFGRKVAGDTSQFGEGRIYYSGLFEPNLTRWISRRLGPGDTFVDVGANIGYFSLLASTLVDNGRLVAVEASPAIFEYLRRNLEINGLSNARAVNVAAYDQPTTVRLHAPPTRRSSPWRSSLTTLVSALGPDLGHEVQAAPLDVILTDDEIATARLVKVDVEGVEWAVARGMGRLLTEGREDLEVVFEVHSEYLLLQGKSFEDVSKPFLETGFRPYMLEVDYSTSLHLDPPRRVSARRLEGPLGMRHIDVVFSRRDAEEL